MTYIVKCSYFSMTTGKHFYTSKPFNTEAAAIAHANTVMQHAIDNPDIDERTCLPSVYKRTVVSDYDVRDYFVYSANQHRHDFFQNIPTTGFINTVSF